MSDHELRLVALQGESAVAVNRLIEESALSDPDLATLMCRRTCAMVRASEGDMNAVLCLAALILQYIAKHQDDAPIVLLCSKAARCLAAVDKRVFVAAAAGSGGELAIAVRNRQRHSRSKEAPE